MVSWVICLPIYDRITCLLFTFYAFTVRQANLRSYFKMLYGVAHTFKNDLILLFGIVSCFTLVMIAFFDCHEWGKIHNPTAVVFFSVASFEALLVSYEFKKHSEKFP